MLVVPRRETQLEQESANRILDLQLELSEKRRVVQRYQNEDSEAGAITEVCTEGSGSSSSEGETTEKSRVKEQVRIAARRLRKIRAKVYNDRLKAAFDAGLLLGQKDCSSSDKSGFKVLLQGKLERRRCVRHLGRAFKRGFSTAIRSAEGKSLSNSTSITHERGEY